MSERYQIKSKIGQGGIGAVYRALDTHLQRDVAIKRLLPPDESESFDDDPTQGLLREATTLSTLQHPNIVSVYDVGKDDDGAFVVMELVDGETFDEVVQRGLMTMEDFTELVGQSLEALIAAQDKNLVHRDIKPTNLMVKWLPSGRFQFKLLDFGLAKFSPRPSKQTIGLGDSILGSIHFMAPEQFERRPLDGRTDLYAIGCIYYFGLTGRYPFDGETAAEVMAAHLQHNIKPVHDYRSDMPRRLANWVMWLVSREVEERPRDAKHALDVFLNPNATIPGSQTGRLVVPSTSAVNPGTSAVGASPTGAVRSATTAYVNPATGQISPIDATGTQRVNPLTGQVETVTGNIPLTTQSYQAVAVNMKRRWTIVGALALVTLIVGILLIKQLADGSEKRLAEVIEYLEGEDPEISREQTEELVEFLNPSRKVKIKDRDALISRVELALEEAEGDEVDRVLRDALESAESTSLKEQLINILTRRGDQEAFDIFLSIARRGDTDRVSDYAAQGATGLILDTKGSERVRGAIALIDLMRTSKSSTVQRRSEAGLQTILEVMPVSDRGDLVSELERSLDDDVDVTARQAAVRLLGLTGTPSAATELTKILAGDQEELKLPALRALGAWPDDSQVDALFDIAANAAEKQMRDVAFQTYIRALANPREERSETQWKSWWQRAFALAGSDTQKKLFVLNGLANIPYEWAKDLLKPHERDPRMKTYIDKAKMQIDAAIKKKAQRDRLKGGQ